MRPSGSGSGAIRLGHTHFCAELLPMAATTLSPRAEMVNRRHVPPAQVQATKIRAFDLMTRAAVIAWGSAEPEQSTNCRDAWRIGNPSGHCDLT